MNQNDYIEIARQAALDCTERHAYLPATPEDALAAKSRVRP